MLLLVLLIESLSFKYYRENWYHLQPLHSYLINSKEIERQFSEIGFKKLNFVVMI